MQSLENNIIQVYYDIYIMQVIYCTTYHTILAYILTLKAVHQQILVLIIVQFLCKKFPAELSSLQFLWIWDHSVVSWNKKKKKNITHLRVYPLLLYGLNQFSIVLGSKR